MKREETSNTHKKEPSQNSHPQEEEPKRSHKKKPELVNPLIREHETLNLKKKYMKRLRRNPRNDGGGGKETLKGTPSTSKWATSKP